MKLRSSPPSPFGRKVKIVARMLGLMDRIEVLVTDTLSASDPVRIDNPLGKIPALILDDGQVLYDSRVIVEFLDHLAGGGRIIPREPAARFPALAMQALADGIMDGALLQRYEKLFHADSAPSQSWLDHQAQKVERGLAALEKAPPSGPVDIGAITVACALGYLDFRFEGLWRKDHPKLVAWLDDFAAAHPSFRETSPP